MERPKPEEIANASTHAVGVILSLIGGVILLQKLQANSSTPVWAACGVYLLSLVAVYLASTLSHCFSDEPRRRLFRQLDQAFIYILIVASYTPFSVAYLEDAWWWILLGIMWTVAICGFASKLLLGHRVQSVSIWLYVSLGWTPALGGMPWAEELPFDCILWIIYGGVAYTAGTIFLFNDRKSRYFHAIWHLFVISGSVIHFIAIWKFVA